MEDSAPIVLYYRAVQNCLAILLLRLSRRGSGGAQAPRMDMAKCSLSRFRRRITCVCMLLYFLARSMGVLGCYDSYGRVIESRGAERSDNARLGSPAYLSRAKPD